MATKAQATIEDPSMSILHDWQHQGPEDPAADEALLEEALELSRQFSDAPEELLGLEDFRLEVARAEAAGELPD